MFDERAPQFEVEKKKRLVKQQEKREGSRFWETTYTYDQEGRVLTQKISFGSRAAGEVFESEREYSYDAKGRLVREEIISGKYKTGEGGKREAVIIYEVTHEFTYDGDSDKPSMELFSRDQETIDMIENEYDDEGHLVEKKTISSGAGERREKEEIFQYDERGRLLQRNEIAGRPGQQPSENYWFRYSYDRQGRVKEERRGVAGDDRPFGVVEYKYEKDGRKITKTNRYGTESQEIVWVHGAEYDDQGNIIEATFRNFEGGKQKGAEKVSFENVYEPV